MRVEATVKDSIDAANHRASAVREQWVDKAESVRPHEVRRAGTRGSA